MESILPIRKQDARFHAWVVSSGDKPWGWVLRALIPRSVDILAHPLPLEIDCFPPPRSGELATKLRHFICVGVKHTLLVSRVKQL
jgi:hypothetical protein